MKLVSWLSTAYLSLCQDGIRGWGSSINDVTP